MDFWLDYDVAAQDHPSSVPAPLKPLQLICDWSSVIELA